MRKLLRILFYSMLLVSISGAELSLYAQNYKWIKGGGANSSVGLSGADHEQVTHMFTDVNGNLYISAIAGDYSIRADTFYMASANNTSFSGNDPHIFLASYTCNGTMRWGKLLESKLHSQCQGFAYDGLGSIYCAGILAGSNKHIGYDTIVTSSNLTSFVARYDTSGKFKWIRFVGADAPATYSGTGIQTNGDILAIDGTGNIHFYPQVLGNVQLTSSVLSTMGTYDLKYDSTGTILSATKMPIIDSTGQIYHCVFNKKTNVLYADANNSVTAGLWAFSASDTKLWFDTILSANINALEYDQNGTIYGASYGRKLIVSGSTIDTNITRIFKSDTNGHISTLVGFNGVLNCGALSSITLLPNGKIAATGNLVIGLTNGRDSLSEIVSEGQNPLFLLIDTTGYIYRFEQLHGDGFYDWGTAITSDAANNIYIGGQVADSIYAFNNNKKTKAYQSTGGETDFMFAKYGYNCNCTIATEPFSMFNLSNGTHMPDTVNFTYTGFASPLSVFWNFGDGGSSTSLSPTHVYATHGSYYVCLTVYGSCDTSTFCDSLNIAPVSVPTITGFPNLRIYPNPVKDQFFIEDAEKGTHFVIVNLLGQLVYSGVVNSDREAVNTSQLSLGIYLLQLMSSEGVKGSIKIIK